MDTFKNHLHLPVTKIDDSERMLSRLKVRLASMQRSQEKNLLETRMYFFLIAAANSTCSKCADTHSSASLCLFVPCFCHDGCMATT